MASAQSLGQTCCPPAQWHTHGWSHLGLWSPTSPLLWVVHDRWGTEEPM